jgi:hypothetical protein
VVLLSKPATACLQGHDASGGGAIRDWYDNPQLEDRLEGQELSASGANRSPTISDGRDRHGLPLQCLDPSHSYLGEEIGTMEFAFSIEVCLMKFLKVAPRPSV